MKLQELEMRDYFCGMFIGRSGSGKTAALASFAEQGKLEILDLDKRGRGILGVKDLYSQEVLNNINIDQSIDVTTGMDALKKKLELYLAYQNSGKLPFTTLAIESVRTLGVMLILESMKLRGAAGKKGHVHGTTMLTDPSDYNYCSQTFLQLLYFYIMPLKCNFILSAWIVNKYGKDPENPYGPNIITGTGLLTTDKWSEEIPGYFDEIYLFKKEEAETGSSPVKFTVKFETDIAKTSRMELKTKREVNITGKKFYSVYKELLNGNK